MDAMREPGVVVAPIAEPPPDLARPRRGQVRVILDRFVRNRVSVAGLLVLALILALAILAPVITHQAAQHNPAIDPGPDLFAPPSLAHPLGTDELGRDQLARLLFGARVSLLVGTASMLMAMLPGVAIGALAGYYGGWLDNLMMRVTDIMLSLPQLLLLFVLSLSFSDGSVFAVVTLIAALAWPSTTRIVRGEFLAIKEREFLLAARTLGAGDLRLILRHLLPNSAGPIIVSATLLIGNNIINESILSFFGFGLNPPQSSWGVMLDQAQNFYFADPLMLYVPGLAILITVLCFNLMGDGLRDALDPYVTER